MKNETRTLELETTSTEPTAPSPSRNHVRRLREDQLLSKAELARRAGLSALTVDRIEAGKPCRMDTKRKIILALGMSIEERERVFPRPREGAASSVETPEDVEPADERRRIGGNGS